MYLSTRSGGSNWSMVYLIRTYTKGARTTYTQISTQKNKPFTHIDKSRYARLVNSPTSKKEAKQIKGGRSHSNCVLSRQHPKVFPRVLDRMHVEQLLSW